MKHLKKIARETLDVIREPLVRLSHRIHAHPEIAFEEERAVGWLTDFIAEYGFRVEAGIHELPTAFRGVYGSGPLRIAFCAEYDALPKIGHGCGHNIIAAASAGAAVATAKLADELGLTVEIIGTPGEEMGNAAGKVLLLERGAFANAHAALMVQPGPVEVLEPTIVAMSMLDFEYHGRAAHACAFPEYGINAADALTIAQVAVGALRQHLRKTDRVHGIITHGGDAPNITPDHTAAKYFVRASTLEELDDVKSKVLRCFEAGALGSGCTMRVRGGDKPNAQMVHNRLLASVYRRNCEALGRTFEDSVIARAAISTDMGNVSLVLPSIHPMIGIDSLPAVNHQPEFAACCISDAGDRAIYDGALALAWTVIDAASDDQIRSALLDSHHSSGLKHIAQAAVVGRFA